jgi:phage protein D
MAGSQDVVGGDNAPTFEIEVNGNRVSDGVRALVQSLEYESIDGMADLLKITLSDPLDRNGKRLLADSTLFAPGNEITAMFGYYGAVLDSVGRGIVRKVRAVYPRGGVPIMEVIAYTKDALMMDNAPTPIKVKKKRGRGKKNSKAGRRFKNFKYSDAVEARGSDYDFLLDVDETADAPHDFIHKAGLTDYDFVKGLSNLTGYYFWVDYDFNLQGWTLHFKNPETYVEPQEKKYDFKWASGEFSTLLDFEPELAIQKSTTKLRGEYTDPLTGQNIEVDIEEETADDESDPIDSSGGTGEGKFLKAPGASTKIKVYLNEFSFEVRTHRRFSSKVELASWVQQWFRRQRENFVMSTGKVIGVETLRARQVHRLSGLGTVFDGDYQFNKVRHCFNQNGYECEIGCRKVIGPLPMISPASTLAPGGTIVDTGKKPGQ